MRDISLRPVDITNQHEMNKLYKAIRMAEDASRVPHWRKDRILDKLETDTDRAYMFQQGARILGAARISADPDFRYIKDFAIFKRYQGKGYGTAAFNKLLDEVPGEGPISLAVGKDNDIAQKLYSNAGFKKVHQFKSTGNWEMQKDAAMSPEEKQLRRLARPYYPAVGRRSWEHVNQVRRNAEMITEGLKGRPLTLQEKAAIYFHDCAIKERGTGKEHGKYGRETALPILLATGIFNDRQLDEIGTAIVEHDELNETGKPFSNETAEVLASGDANPPDLPWLLNKFYHWQIMNNPDKDTWKTDLYETATNQFGTKSTEKFPALYDKFHGDRVQKLREQIDSMSADEMWDTVMKYRKKHRLTDLDPRLGTPPRFQPV